MKAKNGMPAALADWVLVLLFLGGPISHKHVDLCRTSILIVVAGFEVIRTQFAVGELAESLAEQRAVPDAVVAGVVKLPAGASLISLGHRITHDPFGPIWSFLGGHEGET